MITNEVNNYIAKSVLCWLATVDDEGMPNVSPKEIFTSNGSTHIIIANVASPVSVRNIKRNSKVCVSFVDVFIQKGFKLKGEARELTKRNSLFSEKANLLRPIAGPDIPFSSIIMVKIKSVEPIIAPSYHLFPATLEAHQITRAMETYNVQPKEGNYVK